MRVQELIITAREWRHFAQGNMACQKGSFPAFLPDIRHTPLHPALSLLLVTVDFNYVV